MGLDTSHGAWHGAYSAFHRWRKEIAKCLGIPLDLMEGFYPSDENGYSHPLSIVKIACRNDEMTKGQLDRHLESSFPLLWDAFKPSPLHELLYHSDCDGEIPWENCAAIADALELLLPELTEDDLGGHIGPMQNKTKTFIEGLRLAHSNKENLLFH